MKGVPEFLTSKQVAKLIDVGRSSVQRWIDAGELPAFKTPGGHRRVTRRALMAFLRKRGAPIPEQVRARLRLMVVDDEDGVSRNVERVLSVKAPWLHVECVDNGIDALFRIGLKKIDIVLLDGAMPRLDGIEVCKLIKSTAESKHVIVIGMSGSSDYEERFREAKADGFIRKPLSSENILGALAAAGVAEFDEFLST